jgi:hypothetical protein
MCNAIIKIATQLSCCLLVDEQHFPKPPYSTLLILEKGVVVFSISGARKKGFLWEKQVTTGVSQNVTKNVTKKHRINCDRSKLNLRHLSQTTKRSQTIKKDIACETVASCDIYDL